ncbi:MAG: VanZ family protein [Lacticaseibacillus songhuajiangensis]|jgi:VanZ family protein|nr:VanZ family protein [Lacticaseibacillus songhuajiangensis]
MRQWIQRNVWLVVALVVLLILFISSAMTYKQQTVVPLLHHLLAGEPGKQWLAGINIHYADGEVISLQHSGYFKMIEFFIRKFAHFATYFVLGLGIFLGLRGRVTPNWLRLLLTPLSVGGLAALDEFHQSLTGGRSPMVQDVILDMCGGLCAVLIAFCVETLRKRSRKR